MLSLRIPIVVHLLLQKFFVICEVNTSKYKMILSVLRLCVGLWGRTNLHMYVFLVKNLSKYPVKRKGKHLFCIVKMYFHCNIKNMSYFLFTMPYPELDDPSVCIFIVYTNNFSVAIIILKLSISPLFYFHAYGGTYKPFHSSSNYFVLLQ